MRQDVGWSQGGSPAEAAACLDHLLERVTHDVGAHIGLIYLPVAERQVLQMTSVVGAPARLARPWTRLAMAAPAPVQESVRTRQPVWLPDQQALAGRYPRAALAFTYSVAHYAAPLLADGVCWGALNVLWPDRHPGLSAKERARLAETAERMAHVLRDADAGGQPVRPRDEPRFLPPATPRSSDPSADRAERFTGGFATLDLNGRMTFLTDRAAALLDADGDELLNAEPWDVLPWLDDPAYENAFVAALFSRRPTRFSVHRSDGVRLTFLLYPEATGVNMRVQPSDTPEDEREPDEQATRAAPARAGTLFHLLHLASALTEATGVQEVTESIMDQMRPVLGAQGLSVLIGEEGRLRVAGARGFPEEIPRYFAGMPLATPTEGTRTMETGVPRFHPTNAALVRAYPQHSVYRRLEAFAFLPLTVSGGTFGCLVLGYDKPHVFPPDERAELTSLAGMVAQALERARLYDANAQAARGLQDGLLPRHLPRVPGLDAVARYRAATHTLDVGGDFYDLIDFGHRGTAAVIGDVQGHSVRAAALMGRIRTALHSHAGSGASPADVLARTNQQLVAADTDLFCSCVYAHIDVRGRRVLLASAGHPAPILRHPSGSTEVLDLPPGLLLGVQEVARFETVEVPLPPGALLALYTDGLVERPGVDVELSIGMLAERFAGAREDSLDRLADTIVEQAGETKDDTALLLVRGVPLPGR